MFDPRTARFWIALAVVVLGALAVVNPETKWGQVCGIVAGTLTAAGYGLSQTPTARRERAARKAERKAKQKPPSATPPPSLA